MKEIYKKITRKFDVNGKLTEEIEEVTEKEYAENKTPFTSPINPYPYISPLANPQQPHITWCEVTSSVHR